MPLLWLSLACFLGFLLAAEVSLPWWGWLILLFAGVGAGVAQHRFKWSFRWLRHIPLPVGFVVAALFLGALRYQVAHPPLNQSDLAWYSQRGTVDLVGVVTEDLGTQKGIQTFLVRADQIGYPGGQEPASPLNPVKGTLLVKLLFGEDIHPGSQVALTGDLSGSGTTLNSSWAERNASRRGRGSMYLPAVTIIGDEPPGLSALNHRFQQSARATLNRLFPQPEAALLNGILLGYESDLPDSLTRAYQKTGTAHIIAISGFNMAILAGLIFTFLRRRLPLRFVALAAALLLIYYTLLVGGAPSVVRAAVMAIMGLGGRLVGRRQTGVNSLAFCGAAMCLLEPDLPWSASFQLSFAATLGLIWLAEPMTQAVTRLLADHMRARRARQIAGWVGEYFLFTLAAQILTLPIMAVTFGRVSWMALLANPLILPVQPAVMVLGGMAALLGMVWLPLGQVVAAFAYPLAAYTNRLTLWLARFPGGEWVFPPLPMWILTLVFVLMWVIWALRKQIKRWLPMSAMLTILGLGSLLLWQAVLHRPDGRLHLVFPDIGQGVGWMIKTPDGQLISVNAGENGVEWTGQVASLMPYIQPALGALIVTRPDASSMASTLKLMDRYPPRQVLWNPELTDNRTTQQVLTAFSAAESQVAVWEEGMAVPLGDGAVLEAAAMSNRGGWMVVTWQNFTAVVGEVPLDTDAAWSLPEDINLLVVNSVAAESLTPDAWTRLSPASVVWRSSSPIPASDSTILTGKVDIRTDGLRLWLASSNDPIHPKGSAP